jgi:hypothetical protein
MRTLAISLAASLAATTLAREAAAAPPWVDRSLTLPAGDFAFDVGTGFVLPPPTGAGVNLEMGIGLTSRIELGVRTALRFGDAGERGAQPDVYARLFDLQTFDAGDGVVANPEVRLRGALVRGEVGELALEGRVVAPFQPGTGFGMMFGVPVALHLGDRVRLDTGAYLPLVVDHRIGPEPYPVTDRVHVALSIPFDVWIQATRRFWIGPVSNLVFYENGTSFVLGVGLGYQITHAIDFKAMALSTDLTRHIEDVGVGAGVQIRIE